MAPRRQGSLVSGSVSETSNHEGLAYAVRWIVLDSSVLITGRVHPDRNRRTGGKRPEASIPSLGA